jgi:hypothetical protein
MAKNASQTSESISDKIIFDLPATVDVEFSAALRTVLVEASTTSWEFWFGLLEAFNEHEGHSKVSSVYKTEDGFNLGIWVAKQRGDKDGLSSERIKRLDALGFFWDDVWKQNYNAMKSYAEKHGSIHVPYDYVVKEGHKLAQWRASQLRDQSQLSDEKKTLLGQIPEWTWDSFHDVLWESRYIHLQNYIMENGHSCPPATYKNSDGQPVGNWVRIQKRYKQRLSLTQVRKLEEISDWTWYGSKSDDLWQGGLNELKKFEMDFGHVNVQFLFKSEDGYNLGQWISDVRKRYSKGQLSVDRIESLQRFNGWVWNSHDARWMEKYQKIKEFQKREGHCLVPQKWKEDGESLGSWVSSQRAARQSMQPERLEKLDALGFIWNA